MNRTFRFGACFVGKSITDAQFDSVSDKRIVGATSPFAKLIISDDTISLKFFNRNEFISIKELDRVFVSKLGYINFHSERMSFGFSHPDIRNIANELENKGIEVDKKNMKIGQSLIYMQVIYVLIFVGFVIASFILK
jgi:hypothetical protein